MWIKYLAILLIKTLESLSVRGIFVGRQYHWFCHASK